MESSANTKLSHFSFLDDLLLFICVPSFFFYAVVHMAPIVKSKGNVADMLTDILMVAQMMLQTPMIMDGLRRYRAIEGRSLGWRSLRRPPYLTS